MLIAALFLGSVLALPGCTRTETRPALPGNPAPSFKLKDVDGKIVRLADLAGSVIVLDFWATWCGPCVKASAELEATHRKYRGRGVVVVGISVDTGGDAREKVQAFAVAQKLNYLLLLDDGTVKKAYGVTRIPTTFILDRTHVIRDLYPGYRPGIGEEIDRAVEKLL